MTGRELWTAYGPGPVRLSPKHCAVDALHFVQLDFGIEVMQYVDQQHPLRSFLRHRRLRRLPHQGPQGRRPRQPERRRAGGRPARARVG